MHNSEIRGNTQYGASALSGSLNMEYNYWGAADGANPPGSGDAIKPSVDVAAAEVSAQKGHDLFLFNWPKPDMEEQVIDHREIYEEVINNVGKPIEDVCSSSSFSVSTEAQRLAMITAAPFLAKALTDS